MQVLRVFDAIPFELFNSGTEAFHMRPWVSMLLILSIPIVFSFGCTRSEKETFIKCPKCGYYFKTKQGADWFQNIGRP